MILIERAVVFSFGLELFLILAHFLEEGRRLAARVARIEFFFEEVEPTLKHALNLEDGAREYHGDRPAQPPEHVHKAVFGEPRDHPLDYDETGFEEAVYFGAKGGKQHATGRKLYLLEHEERGYARDRNAQGYGEELHHTV